MAAAVQMFLTAKVQPRCPGSLPHCVKRQGVGRLSRMVGPVAKPVQLRFTLVSIPNGVRVRWRCPGNPAALCSEPSPWHRRGPCALQGEAQLLCTV